MNISLSYIIVFNSSLIFLIFCSMFERRPCVDDLADHIPLITEAIKWDGKLEKSKVSSDFMD